LFYGWKIVGAAHAVSFISSATLFYSFPLFLSPIAEDLGIGRALASLIPATMQLSSGALAVLISRLITHYSVRHVMMVGAVVSASGYLLASRATEIWQLCVIAALCFSFGTQSLVTLLPQALIVNWFDRLRGRALGITQLGVSLGGVLMPGLIAISIQNLGWRTTYMLFSASFLIALCILAIFIVNGPEDMGLSPDGESSNDESPEKTPARRIGLAGKAPPYVFWVICGMMAATFIPGPALMPHLVPLATDRGVDLARASWLIVALGTGSLTAKLMFGFLIEKLPMRSVYLVMMLAQLAGLAGIAGAESNWIGLNSPEQTLVALLATTLLFAVGIGGMMPVSAGLISDAFGRASFARRMGQMVLIMTPCGFGSFAGGLVFDHFGRYTPALLALIALSSIGIAVAFLYPLPTRAAPDEARS